MAEGLCSRCGGPVEHSLLLCYPPIDFYHCRSCGATKSVRGSLPEPVVVEMDDPDTSNLPPAEALLVGGESPPVRLATEWGHCDGCGAPGSQGSWGIEIRPNPGEPARLCPGCFRDSLAWAARRAWIENHRPKSRLVRFLNWLFRAKAA